MNSLFPIALILTLSIIVQATAAIIAFRLINITGRRLAWILISVALMLMAVRRVLPLYRLIMGDMSLPPDPMNEIIGLILSISMTIGIASIAPIFKERLHAEEEIRKLNLELDQRIKERTARLEASNKELENFSYSIAHDLRAPLRGIDGFSQALLEDYEDKMDSQAKNYLQRVRAAAQYMAQLIDGLLNLSRVSRSEINIQQTNLSKIVQELADNLIGSQPEREVEFIIEKGIIAQGDSHLLRIVLENLMGNAWKFTSKHEAAKIEFGRQQQNNTTVYFVKDDGVGFDMNYSQKLFGVFQRLHATSEFAGTGIGLATVQRIVQRHGGSVWAEGEVEKGATFYFTISDEVT